MIDVDERLREELHRLVPADPRRDWNEVAARARLKRQGAGRRWAVGVTVLAAAAVLGVSTPFGAALVRSLDDFSTWLTGEPGTPASETEQQAFDEANARSWLRFPQGTRVRHLITTEAGKTTVTLLGFRSGSSAFCVRINTTGEFPTAVLDCAPLAELRRAGGPARVVITDHPAGKGDKYAWYGIDRYHSSALQITAGIAADGVRKVVLEDDAGRHEVPVSSNAFLYVAEQPDVGQRVQRVWASTDRGLVELPFVPAPWGGGGGRPPTVAAPAAPRVERRVSGGRIGWLEAREPRGESLDALPKQQRSEGLLGSTRTQILFGRVLTPDPDRPLRLVVTVNAQRPDGSPKGLCTSLYTRGGSSGGCSPYPDVFERTQIPSSMVSTGSGAFVTISGIASDEVARIEALLADGQSADVGLEDNAFIVDLPRANLPARLVAYDAEDRVIDVSRPYQDYGDRPGPARGRARSLLRVVGPGGATAELIVGPSTDGGECMFVKSFVDERHGGVGVNCARPTWTGPALQVSASWSPPRFISGRVRSDVETVRIRFADGSTTTLRPTRGYILWAVPKNRQEAESGPLEAEGLRKDGVVLARQPLGAPAR